jgi:hypothetical protein
MRAPTLIEQWKNFFFTIADPFSLTSVGITVSLAIILATQEVSTNGIALLTALLSISAGISGGILQNKYEEKSEERIITARAKTATRSLASIAHAFRLIQLRINYFIAIHEKPTKIIRREVLAHFKDVLGNAELVLLQLYDSIENWQDLLPKLDSEDKAVFLLRQRKTEELEKLYELAKSQEEESDEYQEIFERIGDIERRIDTKDFGKRQYSFTLDDVTRAELEERAKFFAETSRVAKMREELAKSITRKGT